MEAKYKRLKDSDAPTYLVGTPVPLADQMVYITRAEIVVGDYFCFLRLPLRVRERLRLLAENYYEYLNKNIKK